MNAAVRHWRTLTILLLFHQAGGAEAWGLEEAIPESALETKLWKIISNYNILIPTFLLVSLLTGEFDFKEKVRELDLIYEAKKKGRVTKEVYEMTAARTKLDEAPDGVMMLIAEILLAIILCVQIAMYSLADLAGYLVVLPFFQVVKGRYLLSETGQRWLELEDEDWFVYNKLTKLIDDLWRAREGFFRIASCERVSASLMLTVRSALIVLLGWRFRVIIQIQLLLEGFLILHIVFRTELSRDTGLKGTIISWLARIETVINDKTISKLEKIKIIGRKGGEVLMKYKVKNRSLLSWYGEEEIYGSGKLGIVLTMRFTEKVAQNKVLEACYEVKTSEKHDLYNPDNCSCSSCTRDWIWIHNLTSSHSHSLNKPDNFLSQRLSCEVLLGELALNTPRGKRQVTSQDFTLKEQVLTNRLWQSLKSLPILAVRQNMLLVGNLGYELAEFSSHGWEIRVPGVVQRMTQHTKTSQIS